MGWFAYYFWHTLRNSVLRFLRTWAFFLLAVLSVGGGLVWYAVSWYAEQLGARNPTLARDVAELVAASGVTMADVAELCWGAFALAILVVQVVGADRSVSRLFVPADVSLLFASDRTPQEVLAFRVANTMGPAIVGAVGMLLSLPLWARGLPLAAALGLVASWCLLLLFSILLKVVAFECGSVHERFRRHFRWFVFAALGLLGLALWRSFRETDDLLRASHLLLNAPASRLVPIWGWVKGLPFYLLEGRAGMSCGVLAASAVTAAGLALACRAIPADYYEEALASAHAIGRLIETAGREGVGSAMARVWGPRRVGAVGIGHGTGAVVYLFRVLHERRRASVRLVGRTTATYAFVTLSAGLYVRLFLDEPLGMVAPLVLCALVFFHAVFSPVTEDIRKASFLLDPEPVSLRLACSLAGGACCCALDCAGPLVVGALAAGTSPVAALAYLPVVVTCDLFASAAGAFVEVSLPASVGMSLRQVIEIVIVYVGLILDGSVLAGALGQARLTVGLLVVGALNVLFAATLTGLTAVWLRPCPGRPRRVPATPVGQDRAARSAYTRCGLALAAMYVAIHAAQLALARHAPDNATLVLHAPVYLVGLPVFLAAAGATPAGEREAGRPLGARRLMALVPVCLFVAYAGNALGLLVTLALAWVGSHLGPLLPPLPSLHAPLMGLTGGVGWLETALLVLATPVMEELVFRRCLLRRLAPFGERSALVVSAALFALFHESPNQCVYAFALGLLLGYVFLRCGRIRYTVALHAAINALSAIVVPALVAGVTAGAGAAVPSWSAPVPAGPATYLLAAYLAVLAALVAAGLVLFCLLVREHDVRWGGIALGRALGSRGVVAFVAVALAALVLA